MHLHLTLMGLTPNLSWHLLGSLWAPGPVPVLVPSVLVLSRPLSRPCPWSLKSSAERSEGAGGGMGRLNQVCSALTSQIGSTLLLPAHRDETHPTNPFPASLLPWALVVFTRWTRGTIS